MKIYIQSKEQKEDKIRVTVAVTDGDTELFGRNFEARTAQELSRTLANFKQILESIPTELELIPVGEFIEPVQETPVERTPTVEEVKEQEISQKESELNELIEKEKRRVEVDTLSKENQAIADKLAELKALKEK